MMAPRDNVAVTSPYNRGKTIVPDEIVAAAAKEGEGGTCLDFIATPPT